MPPATIHLRQKIAQKSMTLSAEQLMNRARTATGIEIDDIEVREPLRVLVNSLNTEACLRPSGKQAIEERLVRLLSNRLRMERDFIAHPEIGREKIVAPLFISGMPRSGTTKMQKLLSVAGDFTELPFWMTFSPSLITGYREENTGERIADTDAYVAWVERNGPKIRQVHPFSTHEPEEVNPILEQAFHNYYWSAFFDIPSFVAWETTQDPHLQLRYLHRTLQYLQWQFGIDTTRPWVLKNPTFVGMEPVIRNVFPDAKLIMTHRHPSRCVASSISLMAAFHTLHTDAAVASPTIEVTESPGYLLLEGLAAAMKQNANNRSTFPELGIIDIAYTALTTDAISVVEQVYRGIGMPFSDAARARITQWEASHPQHQHGAHTYALADFGLTDTMVEERFSDYLREFAPYFQSNRN